MAERTDWNSKIKECLAKFDKQSEQKEELFLDQSIFQNFTAAKIETFDVNGRGALSVDASCSIAIEEGETGRISVAIEAEPKALDNLDVHRDGDIVSISQKTPGICVNSSNSGSIRITRIFGSVSVGDITQINGNTYVNGVEKNSCKNDASAKQPRIYIRMPKGSDLSGVLFGGSSLTSSVLHGSANFDVKGRATADFSVRELDLRLKDGAIVSAALVDNGSTNIVAKDSGQAILTGTFGNSVFTAKDSGSVTVTGDIQGSVVVTAKDSGYIEQKGDVSGSVVATAKDAGRFEGTGIVQGDFNVQARDMGCIIHRGPVSGNITQKKKDMAKIYFLPG